MIHPVLLAEAVSCRIEVGSSWLCKIMLSHLQKMGEGQQLECLKVNHTSGLFHSQAGCPYNEFLTGRAADNGAAGVGVKLAHMCLCCAFSSSHFVQG